MLRFRLCAVASVVFGLTLLAADLAKSELPTSTDPELAIAQPQELELHFSTIEVKLNANTEDGESETSRALDSHVGYWFKDVAWLGVASEAPLLGRDREDSDMSRDADTNFNPMSSFLLFRYPNGDLQPFIGIGPTRIISDLSNTDSDLLQHIFMGLSYRF